MGEGIKIYPSGFPTPQFISIINNTIVDCPYFGIEVNDSWNNIIIGNTINGRYTGKEIPPLLYPTLGFGSGISIGCVNSIFSDNTFVNTMVIFSFSKEGYKDRSIFTDNREINTTIVYLPFPTVTPTASPSPSPTVPELSLLVILPLLPSIFSVAVIVRYRKTAKTNHRPFPSGIYIHPCH